MFLVGLTGGIASGKSTVAYELHKLGVVVLDADVIARQVVEPGKKAWKKISKAFPEAIKDSGEIDREKLGQIIFSDASKRKLLDHITHPEIYKTMFWEAVTLLLKGEKFIVLDLPLLFESGVVLDYLHKIIVVTCNEEQQIERLCHRNALNKEDALRRIKAQMPLEEKCKKAQFIINNSGSLSETKSQAQSIYQVLRQSKQHWKLRFLITGWTVMVTLVIVWLLI
ncbi:hypothetical protein CHUAL_013266 [Chamberlinius hualienensis]